MNAHTNTEVTGGVSLAQTKRFHHKNTDRTTYASYPNESFKWHFYSLKKKKTTAQSYFKIYADVELMIRTNQDECTHKY